MRLSFRLLVALWLLGWAESAFAYLDPGTGSYIIQILAGAALGSLYAIKLYWARIRAFFTRKDQQPR